MRRLPVAVIFRRPLLRKGRLKNSSESLFRRIIQHCRKPLIIYPAPPAHLQNGRRFSDGHVRLRYPLWFSDAEAGRLSSGWPDAAAVSDGLCLPGSSRERSKPMKPPLSMALTISRPSAVPIAPTNIVKPTIAAVHVVALATTPPKPNAGRRMQIGSAHKINTGNAYTMRYIHTKTIQPSYESKEYSHIPTDNGGANNSSDHI